MNNNEIEISIPIDPPQQKHIKEGSIKDTLLDLVERYGPVVAVISFLISVALVIYTPNPLNIVIFIFNVLIVSLQFLVVPRLRKSWGVVFDDRTLEPIPLATITLFDAKTNKLLRSRLSDYRGRFNFLAPPGIYKMLVSKTNYEFPAQASKKMAKYTHLYFGGEFEVKKDNETIQANIPVRKSSLVVNDR